MTAMWVQLALSPVQVCEASGQCLQCHINNSLVEVIAVLVILGAQAVGDLLSLGLIHVLVSLECYEQYTVGISCPSLSFRLGNLWAEDFSSS